MKILFCNIAWMDYYKGIVKWVDVTAFCNAAQDFALDMLNDSYSLAWGNDANS